jgi:thioredoxin reductase
MVHVTVVGGGPAGLSAALFAAKNGLTTTLFDADETPLHDAHLRNYLGVESIDGEEFLRIARRQVDAVGVERVVGDPVTGVRKHGSEFQITVETTPVAADYLVLATGTDRRLAASLGCAFREGVVRVGPTMETSVEDAYAVGATVRDGRWQAVVSAGDGATAALDVLSKVTGEPFHDFDVSPPEDR